MMYGTPPFSGAIFTDKEGAEEALTQLAQKWGGKYPIIIASWQHNWEKLSTYFEYTEPIRKLIYTTNPIEDTIGK